MNKETNKIIPEIRFPEFVNEGEWEEKSIGEVFNSFSGGTPSTSEKEYYGGEIPFIRSAEINKVETELFLTEEGLKNSSAKLVNKGDLLVALYGANSGDSAISKINGAINQAILCLQSEFSNSFAFNFLTLKKDWIVSRFIQGGQGNLSGDIVKSISIPFPKKHEQKKIASCLSSLDDVIAAHSQKLEALKEYKKGLMQNLFPQEGESVPKLRFKEFVEDGEWVEKSLGSLCEVITKGTTPQQFSKTGIRFIKIEAFQDNHINHEKCMFINEDTHNKELRRSILKENDILFAIAGATIGKVNIIKKEILPANTNQALAIVRLKEMENQNFILHILKSEIMLGFIQKSISVGAQPNLNLEQMGSFSFSYSTNSIEQQKIAECLSSLDALITGQVEKTEQLKLHKKGLMQGMFPRIAR